LAKKLTDETRPDTLAARLLQRLPGGAFVQDQLERIEQRLLSELKRRLDRLERQTPSVSVLAVRVNAHHHGVSGPDAPGALMQALLADSSEQSREQSVQASCMAVLRSLVPDEARILAALSDGSGYPLIHVTAAPRLGFSSFPMLEYVSNVGRNAGVLTPELTPAYVRHLAAWGLIETAPEDEAQTTAYELLETDDAVRRVIARVEQNNERARIVRRTLKLSDLGLAMWQMCQIEQARE
jgi:hypothetical protein